MAFRFIHTADIHLDSPLRGLDQYEGAPVDALRMATRRALENLVTLAIDRAVQFVLIAGDLYDGDWQDYNTGLFFVRQMSRLNEAGIPAYLIQGNHDAANRMTRSLPWPDNVVRFGTAKPESHRVPGIDAVIHGQGFATQAVTEDLAATYPPPDSAAFNIGLLHTSVDGREGHDTYAPTTLDRLRNHGYDYWALGHIHQRECLHPERPAVHFPGNLQGRHIRETGPKGCLVVEVDDRGQPDAGFVPLDVVRWHALAVDCANAESMDDCLAAVDAALTDAVAEAEGRLVAARVTLEGATPAHADLCRNAEATRNAVRARAIASGVDQVWVEKVVDRTRPPAGPIAGVEGPLAELDALAAEWFADDARIDTLAPELAALLVKLPRDLREFLEDSAARDDILRAAHDLVLARLHAPGGGED